MNLSFQQILSAMTIIYLYTIRIGTIFFCRSSPLHRATQNDRRTGNNMKYLNVLYFSSKSQPFSVGQTVKFQLWILRRHTKCNTMKNRNENKIHRTKKLAHNRSRIVHCTWRTCSHNVKARRKKNTKIMLFSLSTSHIHSFDPNFFL